LELEVSVLSAKEGQGKVIVTGVVEEEEMGSIDGKKLRRKSMAKDSVENVLTVLRKNLDVDPYNYNIHVNFPGGVPIDGPSAGVTIATAVYSAIKNLPVDNKVAMTGEVSIRGYVKPVGGIVAKVEAARHGGAQTVIIPKDNWQEMFSFLDGIDVKPVETLEEVLEIAIPQANLQKSHEAAPNIEVLSASQM
jgi:Lon-like ATP-dependent protease